MTDSLAKISQARAALAEAKSLEDILSIRDVATAAHKLAQAQKRSLEVANEAKEVQLRAERKAGEFLREMPKQSGGVRDTMGLQNETPLPPTYFDLGIEKTEAHRWQTAAKLPEPKFEEYIKETKEEGKELTSAEVLRRAKNKTHVSHNSGENEWYTPSVYIESARNVLGDINLDPASSELAQSVINADNYYTAENDGLVQKWEGTVWMNPPYSKDLIDKFIAKLVAHFVAGDITEAIVLVNNATETSWFNALIASATAVVFPATRIKFIDKNGKPSGAPLQGQAFIYLGGNRDKFLDEFVQYGWGAEIYG